MSNSNFNNKKSMVDNLKKLKQNVEKLGYQCIVKKGKVLLTDLDLLLKKKGSSDNINDKDKKEYTVLIFRKNNSNNDSGDPLQDTDLMLYPQYVSISEEKKAENINRIKNILQSVKSFHNITDKKSNTVSKYTDIVENKLKLRDNKIFKMEDLNEIKKYCRNKSDKTKVDCTNSRECCGEEKNYNLMTKAYNDLADIFAQYALKRSSEEKHHRGKSNWKNKIIPYDFEGGIEGWYELRLKIPEKNKEKKSEEDDIGACEKDPVAFFELENVEEINEKVKTISNVVKHYSKPDNHKRFLLLSLSFLIHSNRILLDLKNKRIIRIEPHGFKANTFYSSIQLDCLIKKLLVDKLDNFDYRNEQLQDGDVPEKYRKLFGSINIQSNLPLCQIYSAYLQLLSIHYPKYTLMALNSFATKTNLPNRLTNFFKLFLEFLDINITLKLPKKRIWDKKKKIHIDDEPEITKILYEWILGDKPNDYNEEWCSDDRCDYEKGRIMPMKKIRNKIRTELSDHHFKKSTQNKSKKRNNKGKKSEKSKSKPNPDVIHFGGNIRSKQRKHIKKTKKI